MNKRFLITTILFSLGFSCIAQKSPAACSNPYSSEYGTALKNVGESNLSRSVILNVSGQVANSLGQYAVK